MPINDPLICTQHTNTRETLTEIKEELKCIHETQKRQTDMLSQTLSELAVFRSERDAMARAIDATLIRVQRTEDDLADAIVEKTRVIATAEAEHSRFEKDIQSAHDLIREFKAVMAAEMDLFRKEREENERFRSTVKLYAKLGIGAVVAAVTAAPGIWSFLQWFYTNVMHVPIVK